MTYWIGGGLIITAFPLYALAAICWSTRGMVGAVVVGVIGLAILI